jgi:hypothetical protein
MTSDRQAEQVAREKERMSLKSGDSPEKAARYAQEVREYVQQRRDGESE